MRDLHAALENSAFTEHRLHRIRLPYRPINCQLSRGGNCAGRKLHPQFGEYRARYDNGRNKRYARQSLCKSSNCSEMRIERASEQQKQRETKKDGGRRMNVRRKKAGRRYERRRERGSERARREMNGPKEPRTGGLHTRAQRGVRAHAD